jgi:acyl carrier protein
MHNQRVWEIYQRIIPIVQDMLGCDRHISSHASFVENLGFDSLDFADLLNRLEIAFDIQIRSFDDILDTIFPQIDLAQIIYGKQRLTVLQVAEYVHGQLYQKEQLNEGDHLASFPVGERAE